MEEHSADATEPIWLKFGMVIDYILTHRHFDPGKILIPEKKSSKIRFSCHARVYHISVGMTLQPIVSVYSSQASSDNYSKAHELFIETNWR